MKFILKITFSLLFLSASSVIMASQETLKVVDITKNIKAIVGEIGNRNAKNLGNNATFGVIITEQGVILIDSGGTYKGAKAIHEVVKSITNQPIKFVINSGGQDHRWFGNGYFKEQGVKIISSQAAKIDHKNRFDVQLKRLEGLAGKALIQNTKPELADITFEKDYTLKLGKTTLEIHHRGQAHTPGDAFIWLPKEKIMFSGDIVYLERMLGVGNQSNSKSWVAAFEAMSAYEVDIIVPGHGHPAKFEQAKKSTYNYLKFLRKKVTALLDDDGEMSDLKKIDQSEYQYLSNFDALSQRNIQKVFSEIEFE
ncbi:MBL fold metallo-hydrolase [Candidatus Thioglobus sp.]|uniref:MBL fold metallo-hydrolase n=1 Tax=Candidatus Thioglobus sp. TaxID=2026721 RepID=UPI003D0C2379